MTKRRRRLIEELIDDLNATYNTIGWHFHAKHLRGVGNVVFGDNRNKDLHMTYAINMHILEDCLITHYANKIREIICDVEERYA